MLYISLPEPHAVRKLSFYLAMEEFIAHRQDMEDAFFMWQVAPSVIFGRNQQLESEVNVGYCRQNGIALYRRKSGGGCVYADQDNVMLSTVVSGENVGLAFNRFVGMVLLALRKMGVEAAGTSHNDITIDGRKVCGTACYQLPGRSIVHSTLLYDTCMEHMLNAITPSAEKLQRKGVQSVRQRITLLKDHVALSLDEVKAVIRQALCTGEHTLTADDVNAIEQAEQGYLRDEFIHLI